MITGDNQGTAATRLQDAASASQPLHSCGSTEEAIARKLGILAGTDTLVLTLGRQPS